MTKYSVTIPVKGWAIEIVEANDEEGAKCLASGRLGLTELSGWDLDYDWDTWEVEPLTDEGGGLN